MTSSIPIRAVGHERDLVLPVLDAARTTKRWGPMLLDCIDTMAMLDLVGGDPSAWQDVIRRALIARNTSVAPYLIIRLAASPDGQGILVQFP